MKSQILFLMPMMALFAFSQCEAQIQQAKTETIKIYGNCGMCEKTIEKAAFKKGEAKADWDKDTKMAQITYDSSKTNADELLKRIAAAGYDSDKFTAPEAAYANLPECCQYERPIKMSAIPALETPETETVVETTPDVAPAAEPKPATEMVKKQAAPAAGVEASNPLTEVYDAYFALKEALVATDGNAAAVQAKNLSSAIDKVKMGTMPAEQHSVWMKYQQMLKKDADALQGSTDPDKQREYFVTLSNIMYEVMKSVKPGTTVYLDHCPMYNDGKGADWLSRDKGIKNPYYGKQMLTCGKVKETLGQ